MDGSRRLTLGPCLLALALAVPGTAGGALAATYYVDRANPACSNSNPGTESLPYCSIQSASNARGGPGTSLLVKPAVYREQVTINASGTAAAPFVIQALGSPVVVDGSDDFANPALWVPWSGDVWFAASVTWAAKQVVVDGERLLASTELPDDLTPGTFRVVTGAGVYVNIGGDNPGTHATYVGRRGNGFRGTTRAWVVVSGFEVTRTDDNGIYFLMTSSDVTIAGNKVSLANGNGIAVVQTTRATVRDNVVSRSNRHGIYLLNGTTQSLVEGNESYLSVRNDGSGAIGIKVESSSENRIERNLVHHNQDTGLQINFSNTCIALLNRSWANGDQGFDHLGAAFTIHIGEVSYGNVNDGFSFEGGSTGSRVHNSISVNNGVGTGHWDMYVDQSSASGFVSDYNIIWRPDGTPTINVSYTTYPTVAAFHAATGQEAHGLQVDPGFVAPALGNFVLNPGSPAIDSAVSSIPFWPDTDALTHAREDDPSTPNSGAGSIDYAERGALEFTDPCNNGAGAQPEVCDGLDNDCDGTTDEGYLTGVPCSAGVGSCQASGLMVCTPDGLGTLCSAVPGTPSPETCDGADNDCNGADDDVPVPAGSTSLEAPAAGEFSWLALPSATAYDIVRGSVSALAASGGDFAIATSSCLAAGHSGTTIGDPDVPEAGQGYWYLVRGRNCGGPGTYDTGSPSQVAPRDSSIQGSAQACPD